MTLPRLKLQKEDFSKCEKISKKLCTTSLASASEVFFPWCPVASSVTTDVHPATHSPPVPRRLQQHPPVLLVFSGCPVFVRGVGAAPTPLPLGLS